MLKKMKPWEYNLKMFLWQHASLRHIFPDKKEMLKLYPWLDNRMWLLPIAWLYRLIFGGTKRFLDGNATKRIVSDKSKISASGQKRVEMFKELNML